MTGGGLTEEKIRQHCEKILGSGPFRNSARASRFLQFVMAKTLSGRGDDIKEYVLGLEVFDRGEEFDPRVDTVVRTEARRLRSKLLEFYTTEGKNCPVRVEIPKGTYIPSIRLVGAPAADAAGTLAVLPFLNLTGGKEEGDLADGLTEELTGILAGIPGLRVLSRTSAAAFRSGTCNPGEAANLVVDGSVRRWSDRVRIAAQLIEVRGDYHLWARSYRRGLSEGFRLQDEVAQDIARCLQRRLTL